MPEAVETGAAPAPVHRNRWRDAARPLPKSWEPHRKVSVVIPAYNADATLDLTLASLAAQNYPEDLLEVIVVDDGSATPYPLPEIRPKHTTVISPASGWGRANACDTGARKATGDLLLWIDADLILPADHVRSHAAMHDSVADAATKGDLRFVESWDLTPAQVRDAVQDGTIAAEFGPDENLTRQWTEDVYARTDDLNEAGPHRFTILTGASAMLSRAMYLEAGGLDNDLRLGEDSEFAHRLAQVGAVFVPVRSAPAFHLGPTNTQLRDSIVRHYDSPHFARRSPQIMDRRTSLGRQWEVPKILAVVEIGVESARYARAAVDRLLASTEEDLAVALVGPWSSLHSERRRVLDDPMTELYLVREWYSGEGRVRLVDEAPRTGFPSPYLLEVPARVGLDNLVVEKLLRKMTKGKFGLITVPFLGEDGREAIRLYRTAAHSRALRHAAPGESIELSVERVWGTWALDPAGLNLEDLAAEGVDLDAPVGRPRKSQRDDDAIAALESKIERLERRNKRLRSRNNTLERQLRAQLQRKTKPPSVRSAARHLARALRRKLTRR